MEDTKIDRYALLGNPVQHSFSPQIHHAFAIQTQQLLSYRSILVKQNRLISALNDFQQAGGKGVNITLPFKQEACELVDVLSPRAERAGAVNMIHFREDGSRFGDNTDGAGFIKDIISNQKFVVKDKRILLLGAGGAARGILEPLLKESPELIVIANRTIKNAEALAATFSEIGIIKVSPFGSLKKYSFDLVINATSIGLQEKTFDGSEIILKDNSCCYDMVYGSKPTSFLSWAKANGAALCCDGWGMLVEQAAEAFYLWRGIKPDTAAILSTLKKF